MKDLIKNNLGMKILSVVIGILIWFLVSASNDPIVTKRYSNIPVNLINSNILTESGMTYSVESGDTVDIIVKGNKSIMNLITKSDFTAEADLSQLTKWGTARIQVTALRYADRLEITLGNTQVVSVNVEEIRARSLKVVVNATEKPAKGYVIGSPTSSPSLIEVVGPQSKIEKIAGISVDVNVAGASEDVKEKILQSEYILFDENGEEISQDLLTFEQKSLKATVPILKKKEVTIKLETKGNPKEGYSLSSLEYEPKKLVITGREDEIKDLKSITLDSISIEGLSKTYTDEIKITDEFLREKTGKDIQNYDESVSAISVKVVIEKTISRTIRFKSSDIEIRNNKNNYKVAFAVNDYSISFRGAASVVNGLKIDDFEPYINLESIELSDEGESEEHTMNFHHTEPDNVYVTSVSETTIRIRVSQ